MTPSSKKTSSIWGRSADVRYWLIAAPVAVAFVAILGIGGWIGWTMATTPPPKQIEEINAEQEQAPETPNDQTT